jgi:hypothetical protein
LNPTLEAQHGWLHYTGYIKWHGTIDEKREWIRKFDCTLCIFDLIDAWEAS